MLCSTLVLHTGAAMLLAALPSGQLNISSDFLQELQSQQ